MRPDQHKKKRSSDYKKKHGTDTKQKTGSSKDLAGQTSTETAKSEETSSLTAEDEETRRKFGKKTIESNWERYRDISDEEEDRGEDYNVLLSQGGDSSSHSKLAGEEEWDNDETAAAFNIDYDHIARELAKVPFVKRFSLDTLGLNPDILGKLAKYDDHTAETSSGNSPAVASGSSINLLSKDQSSDLGFNFSLASGQTTTLNRNEVEEENKFQKDSKTEMKQEKSELATPEPVRTDSQLINPMPKSDEKSTGLPVNNKSIEKITESPEEQPSHIDSKSTDDLAIDELLQSTSKTDNIENPQQGMQAHEKPSTVFATKSSGGQQEVVKGDEVEDLEDWLDSIL